MYSSIVSSIVAAISSSECPSRSEKRSNSSELDSSRLGVLKSFLDERNPLSEFSKAIDTPYLIYLNTPYQSAERDMLYWLRKLDMPYSIRVNTPYLVIDQNSVWILQKSQESGQSRTNTDTGTELSVQMLGECYQSTQGLTHRCHVGNRCAHQNDPRAMNEDTMIEMNEGTGWMGACN
ncbi:hypothetical protein Tco_0383175 [Tanacetum coccineum]